MRLNFQSVIPVPCKTVFAFFAEPQHLELVHAGWSKVRVLQSEPRVRVGGETWVEVTVGGFIPIVLGFRHTLFEPPYRFAEASIHGPFLQFQHTHEFVPQAGQTVMCDKLELCLPRKFGGETLIEHWVAPFIRGMFHKRAETLARLARHGELMCYPPASSNKA